MGTYSSSLNTPAVVNADRRGGGTRALREFNAELMAPPASSTDDVDEDDDDDELRGSRRLRYVSVRPP